jgi:hypothetical protein
MDLVRSAYSLIICPCFNLYDIIVYCRCGIIGEKLPGCESVSYGPTITGAHSPDERVQISTVLPFWQATVKLMEKLADERQ